MNTKTDNLLSTNTTQQGELPQDSGRGAALCTYQIEELMPENNGNYGAFPCGQCGWVQVSAQWLHDFARNVYASAPAKNVSLTDAEIDDMVFGYAPNCPIGEGRALIQAVLAAASAKGNKQ